MVNEKQRMQYLGALGIDSFMPRFILPNAPESQLCAVSVLSESASEGQVVSTQASESHILKQNTPEQPLSPAAVAPAVEQPVPAQTVVEAGVSPDELLGQLTDVKEFVAKAAKKKSKAVEVPRFSLSLWQLEDQLLVVDSRQPQQALPTENLLQNILLALGYAQQPLPQAHVVRWPIIENRFEAQGVSEARETLAALLTARLEIQPAKYVLLMGAEACHYLLPAEQLAETQDESLINLQGKALTVNHIIEGQTMIVTPSLTDMLRDTSLKAITWQAIQPLRR